MSDREYLKHLPVFIYVPLGLLFLSPPLYGHGEPIDVLVNSVTNRLFALSDVTPGVLEPNGNFHESTLPGIGIRFDSNGVAIGAELSLDVMQPLLYWDGAQVTAPTVAVQLVNPAATQTFVVDSQSSLQTGLSWGTYTGEFAWKADGVFRIDSLAPAPGIYGLAVRVTTHAHGPSTPFLIPLVYSPNEQWSGAELAAGVDFLSTEVHIEGYADFNSDEDVDGDDFLAWQRGNGTLSLTTLPSDGDADLDSDVDAHDLAFWREQFGQTVGAAASLIVPEPNTAWLFIFAASYSLSSIRPRLKNVYFMRGHR